MLTKHRPKHGAKTPDSLVMTKIDNVVEYHCRHCRRNLHMNIESLTDDLWREIATVRSELHKALHSANQELKLHWPGRGARIATTAPGSISFVTWNIRCMGNVISDHSPVQLDIYFPDNVQPQRSWQCDPSLLLCTQFRKSVNQQIDLFLDINDCPDISRRTLWEAFKAYIRDVMEKIYNGFRQKIFNISSLRNFTRSISYKWNWTPPLIRQRRIYLEQNKNFMNMVTKQVECLHSNSDKYPMIQKITEINVGPNTTTCDP